MMLKMMTELPNFRWNPKTQHFESRIYATDPNTGEQQLVEGYVLIPSLWMECLDAMWEATIPYYASMSNQNIVSIAKKLDLKHQATSGR